MQAFSSGNSVGGTAWRIEYNNLAIVYAVDLYDKETQITLPMMAQQFQGCHYLISNDYIKPKLSGVKVQKIYKYVCEEKLRNRL